MLVVAGEERTNARLIYERRAEKNERKIKIPPFWIRLNVKEISF